MYKEDTDRIERIIEQLNNSSDLEKLSILKNNRNIFKVVLDNDLSCICFIDEELEEFFSNRNIEIEPFQEYHGWNEGVIILFNFAGIEAETN